MNPRSDPRLIVAGGPGGPVPPGRSGAVGRGADGWVLAVAVAALAGAMSPWRGPAAVPGAIAAVAVLALIRRPDVLVVAMFVVTAVLSARAWAGLDPADEGPVQGEAVLVSDPEPLLSATRAVARFDGQRVELWAYGPPAWALSRALAGDVVELSGLRRGLTPERIAADPWRRVVGRLEVADVPLVRPGAWPHRLANAVHRRLDRGSSSLSPDRRALLAGLVLGDDRAQAPALREAFSVTGLSHLLAVSGQNVAFVLTAAAPLLRRLRLRSRLLAVLLLLSFFALVTRFEPSVLRAVTMAGLAALATASGRPVSGLRTLALAVTVLLLVDPLLAWSLGFRLSVSASAGILLLAPSIGRWLPVPRWAAAPLAVPLAAQLATAPLLSARQGGMAAMSVPANVLAGPAAGAVMTWGSSAGVVAGYLPAWLAAWVCVPARALLWYLEQVAQRGAGWAGPRIGGWAVVAAVAAALSTARVLGGGARLRAGTADGPAAPAAGRTVGRRAGLAVVAVTVTVLLCVARLVPAAPLAVAMPDGLVLHRAEHVEVVVIEQAVDGARALRALRGRVSDPVELLVVVSGAEGAWRAGRDIAEAHGVELVVSGEPRAGAVTARSGEVFEVGPMQARLRATDGDRLEVEVSGEDGAEAP